MMQDNKYVITCIGYGTRWVETRAVQTGTALVVAQFLLEIITCRNSTPSNMLSNRSKVFSSAVVKEFLRLLDIQETVTSSVIAMWRNSTHLDPHDVTVCGFIAKELEITFAYNIIRKDDTGFSPFVLLYGRELVLSSEKCLNQKIDKDSRGLQIKWNQIRNLSMVNLGREQERDKQRYDTHRRVVEYMLAQEKGPTLKFFHHGNSPAVVVKKLNSILYKISREIKGQPQHEIVNVQGIKYLLRVKMWVRLWMLFGAMMVVFLEDMAVAVVAGAHFQTLNKVRMYTSSVPIYFQISWPRHLDENTEFINKKRKSDLMLSELLVKHHDISFGRGFGRIRGNTTKKT
ncbi:hypothetical protein PR048_013336 [Dryococelus australis]|uniref:Uncharacterized protein n=1 Tax=Dryococelus australis TaxID=614101 RepID=A0ABQ9HSQ6_9NEOP|nr:hypothetical protein PR048_013336 [Dryococelus australis]